MDIFCSLSCPVPCGNCECVDCDVVQGIDDLCGVREILFCGVPGLVLVVAKVVTHLDSGTEVGVVHRSVVHHGDCVLIVTSVEVEHLGGRLKCLVDQF